MTVQITIVNTQRADGDEQQVETVATGRLRLDGEWALLSYSETDDDGGTVHTTVRCAANEVTVERTARDAHSLLRLRQGQRCPCDYGTPFGILPLVAHTHTLCNRLTATGGTLDVLYTLEIGGGQIENTLHLEVRKTEEILT